MVRLSARRTALATALLTLATGLAAVAVAPAAAHAAIDCDTVTTGGAAFYDGPSASTKYDARFSNSANLPGLDTHTPQGVGTWGNWDGGKDLLLVTSYRAGANSTIYGIDPASGATVGAVAIAGSHVGGITTSKGWAFVSGAGSSIRTYRLTDLRDALKAAGTPFLAQVGPDRGVAGASFLTSYGDSLWAGSFNEAGRGAMHEYTIAADGTLTEMPTSWEVPTRTQGLLVTATHFIYSTSYGRGNRSNLYVVRRGEPDLDEARLSCFRAPSMAEGITAHDGTAYLVYESGSYLYRSDPATLNVIPRLHQAPLASLTSLV
jgi:hypothetical protein